MFWCSSTSLIAILPKTITLPKDHIFSNGLKSYMYLLVSYFESFPFFLSYFIISSDSLLILLFLISFQKIPSMHFRSCWFSFDFKTFEVSTCFLSWSSIVFIYFSKAFPREKWANLACSIILIWSEGSISLSVRYSYLSVLPVNNTVIFTVSLLIFINIDIS